MKQAKLGWSLFPDIRAARGARRGTATEISVCLMSNGHRWAVAAWEPWCGPTGVSSRRGFSTTRASIFCNRHDKQRQITNVCAPSEPMVVSRIPREVKR
jgi:hypothetical protein